MTLRLALAALVLASVPRPAAAAPQPPDAALQVAESSFDKKCIRRPNGTVYCYEVLD